MDTRTHSHPKTSNRTSTEADLMEPFLTAFFPLGRRGVGGIIWPSILCYESKPSYEDEPTYQDDSIICRPPAAASLHTPDAGDPILPSTHFPIPVPSLSLSISPPIQSHYTHHYFSLLSSVPYRIHNHTISPLLHCPVSIYVD